MELLTQNSKIKKSKDKRTFNFGIPAYQSASGFKTCPNAAACIEGCYARMGAYTFGNVKPVFEWRLECTFKPEFAAMIQAEITKKRVERVRIHDSGDFYSQEYLNKWIAIANVNPNVEFYAYTKMVSMVKSTPLPSNLRIIFSFGGTQDASINVKSDRHSLVFEKPSHLKKYKYSDASKNDSIALKDNPRIGLLYHGTKSFKNTYWNRVLQLKQLIGKEK